MTDTLPITAPVTPVALPKGWTLQKMSSLIRDVAQQLYEIPTILSTHGLTEDQYKIIASNEFFQRTLEQYKIEWFSGANTQKRLALEAAIALEDTMPSVVARAHKVNEPLNDVVALLKLLAEMSGATGRKDAQSPIGGTERFKIVFNLGGDTLKRESTVTIEANPECPT